MVMQIERTLIGQQDNVFRGSDVQNLIDNANNLSGCAHDVLYSIDRAVEYCSTDEPKLIKGHIAAIASPEDYPIQNIDCVEVAERIPNIRNINLSDGTRGNNSISCLEQEYWLRI